MTKKILIVLNLFAFITIFSQTGIGTHAPEGALDINSPNNEWGLVFPHVDEAENTKNPTGKNVKKGTVVYDLKENCIKYFNGDKWSGCILAPIADPVTLECSLAVLNQNIIANYPVSAQTTVSIPYSNAGEAFGYEEIVMLSKNVTGLMAVLPSGFIKKGSGALVFSISGVPSSNGEAIFSLNIAGVQCEFVITAKNYTDIEVPITNNFACDLSNQLGYTTLKGKHIISGKEVTVDYSGLNIISHTELTACSVTTLSNSLHLGYLRPVTLIITFSHPVTNIGIAFTAADYGEQITFTINNNQPIQLNSNGSCQESIKIVDNKIINIVGGKNMGGNIIVGGKWFTELTIQHNGKQNGSAFGFCLNSGEAL